MAWEQRDSDLLESVCIQCVDSEFAEGAEAIRRLRAERDALVERVRVLEPDAKRFVKLQKMVLIPRPNSLRLEVRDYRSPPLCNLAQELDAISDAAVETALAPDRAPGPVRYPDFEPVLPNDGAQDKNEPLTRTYWGKL